MTLKGVISIYGLQKINTTPTYFIRHNQQVQFALFFYLFFDRHFTLVIMRIVIFLDIGVKKTNKRNEFFHQSYTVTGSSSCFIQINEQCLYF